MSLPNYTPNQLEHVQGLLFGFHLRAIEEGDIKKAIRFSLLMNEIARNWRFHVDPAKFPVKPK